MNTKSFWRLFLCFILLPILAGVIVSGCGRGQTVDLSFISACQGDAQIKKTGTASRVKAENITALSANDVIKIGPGVVLSITFFDWSVTELEPNTQIEVKELVKGKKTSIRLKQQIGSK
jgi:hypothetical protein